MGPMFYLVQSHGVRDPISAVVLGNWPHEFALAPFPGKGGLRPRPPALPAAAFPVHGGLRRSGKKLGAKFAPSDGARSAALCC